RSRVGTLEGAIDIELDLAHANVVARGRRQCDRAAGTRLGSADRRRRGVAAAAVADNRMRNGACTRVIGPAGLFGERTRRESNIGRTTGTAGRDPGAL